MFFKPNISFSFYDYLTNTYNDIHYFLKRLKIKTFRHDFNSECGIVAYAVEKSHDLIQEIIRRKLDLYFLTNILSFSNSTSDLHHYESMLCRIMIEDYP